MAYTGRREDCAPGSHATVAAGPCPAAPDACGVRADWPGAGPASPRPPGLKVRWRQPPVRRQSLNCKQLTVERDGKRWYSCSPRKLKAGANAALALSAPATQQRWQQCYVARTTPATFQAGPRQTLAARIASAKRRRCFRKASSTAQRAKTTRNRRVLERLQIC